MKSLKEVGVENFSDEVERISLDVDERQQEVDDLLGRELHELVLLLASRG